MKPPNRVGELLRARDLTNRPPRACRHVFEIIAGHADFSTGRNAYPSAPLLIERTGKTERQIRRLLQRLRGGGWLAYQAKPDEHVRKRYEKIRHFRPSIYYVVFTTFRCSRPGRLLQIKGDIFDTLARESKGDISDTVKDDIGDRGRVTLAPPDLPSDSSTASQLTRTERDEAPESRPPLSRGGLVFSEPASTTVGAPLEVSRQELRQTVRAALKILEKPLAVMSTEASWTMTAALEDITARGRCCLECALVVPYWVMHGDVQGGEVLRGMNQRTNLAYLWGPAWGNLMGDATAYYQELPPRARDGHRDEMSDLNLYDIERPEEDYAAIRAACRWCPKRKAA